MRIWIRLDADPHPVGSESDSANISDTKEKNVFFIAISTHKIFKTNSVALQQNCIMTKNIFNRIRMCDKADPDPVTTRDTIGGGG